MTFFRADLLSFFMMSIDMRALLHIVHPPLSNYVSIGKAIECVIQRCELELL